MAGGLAIARSFSAEHTDPAILLQEVSGDQRYILDYLTEEVLRRQPQEVQTFLLCTSIFDERFDASLCDAVMEQMDSHQMLNQLEQANLFLVSLDNKRRWYRYHALFTEALYYQLKQIHGDLIPLLHLRASRWYAERNQMTEAILHALRAGQWQWAAELIERRSFALLAHTWGASTYALNLLQQWLASLSEEQRPEPALEGLEPVLQRAITGQRWGHVIEMQLLQAQAYQMLKQEMLALSALTEAVRLGESEGYIRSFVDEGTLIESLLYRLRRRNREHRPTPYLDTLLISAEDKDPCPARSTCSVARAIE